MILKVFSNQNDSVITAMLCCHTTRPPKLFSNSSSRTWYHLKRASEPGHLLRSSLLLPRHPHCPGWDIRRDACYRILVSAYGPTLHIFPYSLFEFAGITCSHNTFQKFMMCCVKRTDLFAPGFFYSPWKESGNIWLQFILP